MRLILLLFLMTMKVATEHHNWSEGNEEEGIDADSQGGWIDPLDPMKSTRGRPDFRIDPLDPTNSAGKCTCASSKIPLSHGPLVETSIKRILNGIFHELRVDPKKDDGFDKIARIRIRVAKLERIASFLEAEDLNEWNAHEQLCADLEGMITVIHEEDLSKWSIGSLTDTIQPYMLLANLLVLLPAAILLLRLLVGTRSLFLVTLICFFAFSIYAAYDRRYTEELAKSMEDKALYKGSCRQPTTVESFLESFQGLIWTKPKSGCRRYIESEIKSIHSEIQLFEIAFEVIFNGIFAPISVLGTKFNQFFINFYKDMPIPIAIIATIALLLFTFFFMGYRIRTPLIAIEHHGDAVLPDAIRAAAALLPQNQPRVEPIQTGSLIEEIATIPAPANLAKSAIAQEPPRGPSTIPAPENLAKSVIAQEPLRGPSTIPAPENVAKSVIAQEPLRGPSIIPAPAKLAKSVIPQEQPRVEQIESNHIEEIHEDISYIYKNTRKDAK